MRLAAVLCLLLSGSLAVHDVRTNVIVVVAVIIIMDDDGVIMEIVRVCASLCSTVCMAYGVYERADLLQRMMNECSVHHQQPLLQWQMTRLCMGF